MATLDPAYAKKAAKWYEATTEGLLAGLAAQIAFEIDQQKTLPQPTERTP
jgi:hypothetical protein